MSIFMSFVCRLATLLLMLCCFSSAWATAGIGKVIVSVGKVEASSNGEVRNLERRSPIYGNDVVTTQINSKTQLRFTDGSMISLSQSSLFKVEEYQYGGSKEKAVYHLLKGSMQAISGAIGKVDKSDYEMKTPVATIGIRGTYYQLKLTQDGGLIGGVKDGAIVINNNAGTANVVAGEFFEMLSADSVVTVMNEPPAGLQDDSGDESSEDSAEESEGGNDASAEESEGGNGASVGVSDAQEPTGVNTNPGSYDDNAGGSTSAAQGQDAGGILIPPDTSKKLDLVHSGNVAPDGTAYGIAFISEDSTGQVSVTSSNNIADDDHRLYTGANKDVTYLEEYDASGTCNVCQFDSGSAGVDSQGEVTANAGGNAVNVGWGRWVGSFVVAENGEALNAVGQFFHYITSDQLTPYDQLTNLSGSATFTYAGGGGTLPTDETGVSGTMNSSSLTVDFDAMAFTAATMNLTLNASTYDLMLSGGSTAIDTGLVTQLNLQPSSAGAYSAKMETQFVGTNPASAADVSVIGSYELDINGINKAVGVAYYD